MTIEITYCKKYSTNHYKKDVESVQVKPKRTRFELTIKKAKVYNQDIDNDLFISQVTKIESSGFRNTVCLSHSGKGIPRPVIRARETSPLKRSVWDDIYCLDNTDLFENEESLNV
jgi:hypothetical protein